MLTASAGSDARGILKMYPLDPPNKVVVKGVQLRLRAAAAGGYDSPKGAGGCAPPPPPPRTTGVGRRGGEARRARRAPQCSPGKGVGLRRLRCGPRLCFRRRGPLGPFEPGARPQRGGGGGCARGLAVYERPRHRGALTNTSIIRAVAGTGRACAACSPGASPAPDLRESARAVPACT
jgi:hypothetical protein